MDAAESAATSSGVSSSSSNSSPPQIEDMKNGDQSMEIEFPDFFGLNSQPSKSTSSSKSNPISVVSQTEKQQQQQQKKQLQLGNSQSSNQNQQQLLNETVTILSPGHASRPHTHDLFFPNKMSMGQQFQSQVLLGHATAFSDVGGSNNYQPSSQPTYAQQPFNYNVSFAPHPPLFGQPAYAQHASNQTTFNHGFMPVNIAINQNIEHDPNEPKVHESVVLRLRQSKSAPVFCKEIMRVLFKDTELIGKLVEGKPGNSLDPVRVQYIKDILKKQTYEYRDFKDIWQSCKNEMNRYIKTLNKQN